MRRGRRAARLLSALALLLPVALAASPGRAEERIRSFRSDVTLAVDGSFDVFESIAYSFGDARKHGIYRDIPVAYGRGSLPDYRIALDVLSVTDAAGDPLPYHLSRQGGYQRIRIGDADRFVSGEQTYVIHYRVRRGILWLDDHDELYWNATGTEWKVPIDRASATVTTPAAGETEELRALCFTGPRGSLETDCRFASSGSTTRFDATRPFAAREGLTLVLALPKGVLEEPSALRRWLDRASDWVSWATAMPLLVFFGMGAHWWRHGRDPAGALAVPVRYEPPEQMTPAEMGVVLDQRVHMVDITASILDLAVRGVLRIEEVKTRKFLLLSESDYVLHRLDADRVVLKGFEQRLLDALFDGKAEVALSSLKNAFYTSLPGIRRALYEQVSQPPGAWFPARPDAVRTRYVAISLGIAIPLAVVGMLREQAAFALSMVLCGGIAALWSVVMPRRTLKGRRAEQHIRGFREFVERVEKDRLERLGMRDVAHFERLLPYAFVLGVADPWAEAFADLYSEPPRWFTSADGGSFRPSQLVDRVGHALAVTGSTLSSQPRGSGSSGFGGGGSSGGGFGGGGGGSW